MASNEISQDRPNYLSANLFGRRVVTTPDDLHSLTGVYVVDALTGDERDAFEQHLYGCQACSREVRQLREAVVLLAAAVACEPARTLCDRVMACLDD